MYQRQDGDSTVQQTIEQKIYEQMKKILQADDLQSNPVLPIQNAPDIKIKPDFYSESKRIIGEIHVHLGRLKAAQKHKVASDILKLHLFDMDNQYKKYYVVCSQEEYAQLTGQSYLALAIRKFGIQIYCAEIDETNRDILLKTMRAQNMFDESSLYERSEGYF